jgi:hypothetical protein
LSGWLTPEGGLESTGRDAQGSPECSYEVRRRCKAGTVGHLGDRFPRILQQCDPSFKSAENDVPMRCHARLLMECADEVVYAQTRGAGQLF